MPPRPSELEEVVLRLGFEEVRSTGSHRRYRHSDGRRVTIPFHPRDVPYDAFRGVLKQLGITEREFNRILRGR
ncbi:MAG: addiction module toxin, HicA family [Dehalococcoidia bacterium]|nr:addiction module toxin, HicA family [Dehalococcoidia bacterium]